MKLNTYINLVFAMLDDGGKFSLRASMPAFIVIVAYNKYYFAPFIQFRGDSIPRGCNKQSTAPLIINGMLLYLQ